MGTAQAVPAVTPIEQRGYAHPEVLVSTDWVAQHLNDPKDRLVESNEDILLYDTGHIPGAVKIDWTTDLNDQVIRDYVDKGKLQSRLRWVDEGRKLSTETPSYPAGNITVADRNDAKIRAFREDVLQHLKTKGQLVDVRSPEEYRGEKTHMPEYPQEGCLRGGHIPGAKSVPWAKAIDPDTHTFKSAAELRKLYEQDNSLKKDQETIAYCRIGERSSHTWFALTYLLGHEKVRNYDGSWTEWGNAVRLPVEKP